MTTCVNCKKESEGQFVQWAELDNLLRRIQEEFTQLQEELAQAHADNRELVEQMNSLARQIDAVNKVKE